MDRSLDEIIDARPSRGRGGGGRRGRGSDRRPAPARAPRREEYPRDGVRKYRRDEPANIDADWVHDRFEDDRYDRMNRRGPVDDYDRAPRGGPSSNSAKLRVDNIHYELTEDDLRELFERIGPVQSVRLLYDRADRSQGTAFVIYEDYADARQAIRQFDGCNANEQPIRITMMPSGPGGSAGPKGSLFDRMEKPPRSLFERIESSRDDAGPRRRRARSDSPRGGGKMAAADVDRYVPGRASRSPIRRRGTPREGGRRPGQRREEGGRGGRRARTDDEGRPLVGGRPRKTAEELDAEMADYWGGKGEGAAGNGAGNETNGEAGGDIDMDI